MKKVKSQTTFQMLERAAQALGIEPGASLLLADAGELARRHVPSFPPSLPALITGFDGAPDLAGLRACLRAAYPADQPLRLAYAAPDGRLRAVTSRLEELTGAPAGGELLALFVPPRAAETAFEAFQEVVARLRAPDGCPWDREQTHETLRKHLLEETYEALDAIDRGNAAAMAEELGDLLLQIVLHAQIASETGEYDMAEVVRGIHTKIVRRHPHVFGEVKVDGVSGVLQNWDRWKEEERKSNGTAGTKGLLDGVPNVFPSLAQAQELQERVARVGFDWKSLDGVMAKVLEEVDEVRAADGAGLADELGDLLFSVVNLARWHKVDAETALRQTNARFRRRFAHIEAAARAKGVNAADLGFDELNRLWEESKKME